MMENVGAGDLFFTDRPANAVLVVWATKRDDPSYHGPSSKAPIASLYLEATWKSHRAGRSGRSEFMRARSPNRKMVVPRGCFRAPGC